MGPATLREDARGRGPRGKAHSSVVSCVIPGKSPRSWKSQSPSPIKGLTSMSQVMRIK